MGRYDDDFGYGGWAPCVPVAERRRRAMKKMKALRKKGVDVQHVAIDGRKIAKSFWGEAWCQHLESFSDFENRLPRGRTYVRNGSVCHLAIAEGKIEAKVYGSELYNVKVSIKTLPRKKWTTLKKRCGGRIGSLLELLEGRLSDHVMETVTDRKQGLFPLPGEMSFRCSCPDWARMCKHVAAVLYGVGARLDLKPELLFTLRGVDHEELIEADAEKAVVAATSRGKSKRLAAAEIGDVFGIEIDPGSTDASPSDASSRPIEACAVNEPRATSGSPAFVGSAMETETACRAAVNKRRKTAPGKKTAPGNSRAKKSSGKSKGTKSAKAKKSARGGTAKVPAASRKKTKRLSPKRKP